MFSLFCAALALLSGAGMAAEPNVKAQEYRRAVVSKQSLVRSAASAAYGQIRDRPKEWGQGAAGYVKRFGSSVARGAVKQGIQLGVSTWHHENLHYQRSDLQGTWPRVQYAVKSTFIVPRTDKPGKTFAAGRVAGNVGAGVISRAWQPASTAGLGAGLASGGIGIGADVGLNVAREFWPRKKQQTASSR